MIVTSPSASTHNLSPLLFLERSAAVYPHRAACVYNGAVTTYALFYERVRRQAAALRSLGVGPGDRVAFLLPNLPSMLEANFGPMGIGAVLVALNIRLSPREIAYILNHSGSKVLVFDSELADTVRQLREDCPGVETYVQVRDTAPLATDIPGPEYEQWLASVEPLSDLPGPATENDTVTINYTSGTTGMPKGVVWDHRNFLYSLGGAVDQTTHDVAEHPQEIIDRGKEGGMAMFSIAPLMHGATQSSCISRAFEGDKCVLMRQFEPHEVWRLVEEEKINSIFIIGDAMGRPMIEAYIANKDQIDASSLFLLVSSGAVFSPAVKDQYFEHFPELILLDSVGASEVGGNGVTFIKAGETEMTGGGPTFNPGPGTVVIDEETMTLLKPGDEKIGKVARSGYIPLEYYKDPEKSAATFVTLADGVRYSMPGDFARYEADGNITLLGRGSVSINSGGEKIFPEEVEAAAKAHPAIFDCVAVGVPDEKWGSRVALVAMPRSTADKPDLATIQTHCRTRIAGYKIPRELHYVDDIPRSPAGKPSYAWAKSVALGTT